jgi:hypothetical protein
MGEGRNVYRVLVEKPEGKRPLGRPRKRWEQKIRMDFREINWGRGEVWSGFTWLSTGTGGFWRHEVSYYESERAHMIPFHFVELLPVEQKQLLTGALPLISDQK